MIALALLALGEAAPAAFPVWVTIDARDETVVVQVDGATHTLPSQVGGHWTAVALEQPGPGQREYQVDGSDTTVAHDRDLAVLRTLERTPLYTFDAWLRDEPSFSRWEHVQLIDLSDGRLLAEGREAVETTPLPSGPFRLEAALRRPEAPAHVWLESQGGRAREGLVLDRDTRDAKWEFQRPGAQGALPRWFFPEQAAPFLADLLHLVGRSAAAGFGMVVLGLGLAWAASPPATRLASRGKMPHGWLGWTALVLLGAWLMAAAWTTVYLYHGLPHVLDAVSYYFEAGIVANGRLWLAPPPLVDAFRGPFQVIWHSRWFSQYPPGAPAAYALGRLLDMPWLIGPLGGLALLVGTAEAARRLFGPGTALLTLALGAMSPFILFQAGSYLSHPIAGGLLGVGLALFAIGEERAERRWLVGAGAMLGTAFLAREAASALFAIPLVLWLLARRRWRDLELLALGSAPFVILYLIYNAAVTGQPFQLPRLLFSPEDHFGFGNGIGFHQRHTPAAGLVNTDELLTLLQFDLFGWPPLFSLGLLGLPCLLGTWSRRDAWIAFGALLFVLAHWAYFYHGIALGPRYYYEALPWLLLLAARGLTATSWVISRTVRSASAARVAVAAVALLLSANTFLFYLPREIERRADYSGLPDGKPLRVPFVSRSLFGSPSPHIPGPALVTTGDWWLFNAVLVPLNCAALDPAGAQACPVLFAYAPNPEDEARLVQAFPGRQVFHAFIRDGTVQVESSSR